MTTRRPLRARRRLRGRGGRKGQVSAIATLLTLMLVVTYIGNYLTFTLPSQMTSAEFGHLSTVENQVLRLRSTVVSSMNARGGLLTVPSPITLGSPGVAPFGSPALGTLGPEASSVAQTAQYTLETITPTNPSWGIYSACLPGGQGLCSSNSHVNYANFSGNNTALNIKVTGGNNSLVYNLNGNNDTISITWNGKNVAIVAFVINGSYDSLTFNKGGSDNAMPVMNFYFYGIHDTYSMSMSGSGNSKAGIYVGVQFIGSIFALCPSGNLSASDSVGTLGAGGTNVTLNVTWWNAVGYVSTPHTIPYPGGTLPSESVTWQNTSGSTVCPFLRVDSSQYISQSLGGLFVHLQDRYLSPADVGFEDGAVLLGVSGSPAVMLAPPRFWFNQTPAGLVVTLTLVQLSGSIPTLSGIGTAVVETRTTSLSSATYGFSVEKEFMALPYYLNITTQFPGAWMHYFSSHGAAFPYGATCTVRGAPLPSGSTCLAPPLGWSVTIVAPVYAQSLTVRTVQVAVTAH